MPTLHAPARRPAGFTLIEVVLAMAIMAVICGTIYQFTGTTVQVANVATRVDTREQAFGGLRRLLAAQFAALPTSEPQALVGKTSDGKRGRQDTLQMLSPAGDAVLTPDARGLYQVSLEVREVPAGSGRYTLIMDRQPWTDSDNDNGVTGGDAFQLPAVSAGGVRTTGGGGRDARPAGWVRLLDGVRSLQLDYFDPRLNTWVDKWNDTTMTPSLVRMRLATENSGEPYEFVEKVPGGGTPRLPANLAAASLTLPNGMVVPNGGALPSGAAASNGNAGRAPTNPPPGPPPTLPPGLRPPTGAPPMFDPTKPFVAPATGTGLPPGFR